MRRVRFLPVALLLLGPLAGAAALIVPGASAAGTTVAVWHMDEAAGANTMVDSAGSHSGNLTNVETGVPGFQGSGYHFNGTSSKVVVPSSGSFGIGNANFSFTVHVKFSKVPSKAVGDYDLLRGTPGGAYKLEIVARKSRTIGVANCFFNGSGGKTVLTAGPDLADNAWHTLRCEKTASAVRLVVDGQTFSKSVTIGSISNASPLSLGAKSGGGDWYDGLMDEVSISVG
jgi:hypothetical protein